MTDEFVTRSAFASALEIAGKAVRQTINKAINPASARIAALEARVGALSLLLGRGLDAGKISELEAVLDRIKSLEERLPLAYGGTLTAGQQANKGFFYTSGGSIWFCRESTRDRPGTSDAFVLACKRGNDGKDSR